MAGLEELPDASKIALLVRRITGEDAREVRPLGSGVTSIAWRVATEARALVVLVARPASEASPTEAPRYGAQLAVFDALSPEGGVPEPVAWHSDEDHEGLAPFPHEWAIVGEIDGAPAEGALGEDAARDLGRLLARLHGLPSGGFGRLEDRRDALSGGAPSMAAGLLERWPDLWPFDGSALIAHPVARLAPRHLEALSALREPIVRFGQLTRGVVLHGDLNAAHIFVREDGRLSGVIDFSDGCVGPPALDIASFAHFHGWVLTDALLEGYSDREVLRDTRRAEAHLFEVAHALQKLRKHQRLGQPERVERTLAILDETMPLAARTMRG